MGRTGRIILTCKGEIHDAISSTNQSDTIQA